MRFNTFVNILILFSVIGCNVSSDKLNDDDLPVWIEMMEQPDMEMKKVQKKFDLY